MKKIINFSWEIAKTLIIALAIVFPIRYFLFQPFLIRGQSMEPNFENGDYLIVDELSYWLREPQRGEVVVFKYPRNPSQRYIKRIIGLPGETVEIKNGRILVSGKVLDESVYLPEDILTDGKGFTKITLGKDQYFVLGDNRTFSSDSRLWGVLEKDKIIGRAYFRLWPVAALAKISSPNYQLSQ